MKLDWEVIDEWHQRCKVFGGWLVKATDVIEGEGEEYEYHVTMVFVPDQSHEWK